ncbi:glycoside hydrolase family 32 protein [Desertivirga brevis]|uniref:glycoside hydrolase family 32 protein n=1 Tax=Desertivirga brevis TaxID=2810310 RepID=UPI001A96745F|nr:glycoside hydrolase family 32 protein [Pedobacter sp. SYSU D00873]
MKTTAVKMGVIAMLCLSNYACKQEKSLITEEPVGSLKSKSKTSALTCTQQTEQTDYSIYKMTSDGYRVGDVAPYYDEATGKFVIYYLKDIWDDATNNRHPMYAFTTNNFHTYTATGQIIGSSSATCAQDNAVGAGSVVKSGSTYYFFYSGRNNNYLSCGGKLEGVVRASSSSPTTAFTKNTSFPTITVPMGQGYDENDNFRDPYVFLDGSTWHMLLTARKNVNGTWKGVIVRYTSTNLTNWTHQGVLYDGGPTNYFNMECPQMVKLGSTYYLIYSDQQNKYMYYRKSSSLTGPWSAPTSNSRFEGNGFFAGKIATDQYGDSYIFAWTQILSGHTDSGSWIWGGNMVVHKIYQRANGDLAVTIPHTLQANLNTNTYSLVKSSQWGNVTNTVPGTQSYRVISPAPQDVANVIYEPVNQQKYKISAIVRYASSSKDFGFMIGACDGYNNFYSLRFVPSQNRFSFDKTAHGSITSTTVATNDVPFPMTANTDYNVEIVVENSMVVVYIDNVAALSCRIYKAQTTNWGIFSDNSDATFSNITVKYP